MADLDEYAEVRCNGDVFRDWTGVQVQWAIGSPPISFSLSLIEPSDGAKSFGALRLKPGDTCDVILAGQTAVKDGIIEIRQPAFDAERHGVQVSGHSRAIDMVDSSVEVKGGQFRKQSFSAIAASVLQPFGIKFRLANAPSGADRPFDNASVQHGETAHEFLERLARQRGIWLTGDERGDLVGGVPDSAGAVTLTEGVDILIARGVISDKDVFEKTWVRSQMQGSDEASGKKVAQISAVATNPNGRKGKTLILIAEEPVDQKGAQERAEHEMRKQIGTSVECSITVRGWLRSDGKLWKPGDKVTVRSPMLFPTDDGSQALQVLAVAFSQTEGGSTTTLELVLEGMFANATAGGNQASQDFFGQKPAAATPEPSAAPLPPARPNEGMSA